MVISIESKENVILVPENMLDVKNAGVINDQALVIAKGRIKEAINIADIYSPQYAGFRVMQLSGLTLLPGLIDCHVHFALDGVDFSQTIARWEKEAEMDVYAGNTKESFLRAGVVAVRDGGDKSCISLKIRDGLLGKGVTGPIVKSPGYALRRAGLYGSFLGPGVDAVSQAEKQIAELVAMGVDQIKVVVSGIVSFSEFGKVGPVQFSVDELSKITEVAHDQGLKVMAHASSDAAVKTAVLSGVDSVEHGYFIQDDTMRMMAERGVAWVPTVFPMAVHTYEQYAASHSEEELAVLKRTWQPHRDKIKKAYELGVRLGLGTDAGAVGVPHGSSLYEEMLIYRQAGLSNQEIIKIATSGGAGIIGAEDELGTLEPGKRACLIATAGNPYQDLTVLQEIREVIMPGE